MKTASKVVINFLLPLSFFSISSAYAAIVGGGECLCEIADICKDEKSNVHRPCNQKFPFETSKVNTDECRAKVTYGQQTIYRCGPGEWVSLSGQLPADFKPEGM